MRAYFFGNLYLSSIQQGIQAGHVISELFITYNLKNGGAHADVLEEWAEDYKTIILLNGGYSQTIRELYQFFSSDDNPYPWSIFNEGDDALDGALTCAGIILPEKIYEGAKALKMESRNFTTYIDRIPLATTLKNTNCMVLGQCTHAYNPWEIELMERLNTFRLAS